MASGSTNDWAAAWRQGRVRDAAALACRAHSTAGSLPDRLDALAGLTITGESSLANSALEALCADGMEQEVAVPLALQAHQLGRHALGLSLCRSASGAPDPLRCYLHGTLAMFCGETDEAERMLERCLAASPSHAGARWTLSQLRRWTHDRHHLEHLTLALRESQPDGEGAAYLWFAAFKELDDMGAADAWTALVRGCLAKRRTLTFDGEAESRLVDMLIDAFPPKECAEEGGFVSDGGPTPVFIVGMPRSGTTLLEHILGGHPNMMACGELMDFPKQLQWSFDRIGGHVPDATMVASRSHLDTTLLGQRYQAQTRWRASGKSHYIDKLPRNFWNLGFIAQALPQAVILHMVRDPMDVCFSNLKELFGNAYPYSYNLTELGEHHAQYRRLMRHWHAALPGRILDVSYEALVRDPEHEARKALSHCGLEWDPACLAANQRTQAVATASTVQVREPIHQRSIGGWRRYARQLEPLRLHVEGP
jgi:Sulfotransferase family